MATIEEFEQTVTDKVIAGLHDRFADYERRGVGLTELGDPDRFVERILRRCPPRIPGTNSSVRPGRPRRVTHAPAASTSGSVCALWRRCRPLRS